MIQSQIIDFAGSLRARSEASGTGEVKRGLFLRFGSKLGWMLAAVFTGCLLTSCSLSDFEKPERVGPPLLVMNGEKPQLWLLMEQEEQKTRFAGKRRSSFTESLYHFDLHVHDAQTTERVSKKSLLIVKAADGGRNATARILGPDSDVVWLFLGDQPVALATDGSVVADAKLLEEKNPALRGLLAKEGKFYAFDAGLIVTTADGRRYKVRAPDYLAEAYVPVSNDYFRQVEFMATQWNGGYRTADFLTRAAMMGGKWLGLFTEKEAADAGSDGFGDNIKKPEGILDEGSGARRTIWTARIGRTKEFSEGSHDRLFDLTKMPGAADYLEAGFLKEQGKTVPQVLEGPTGWLVLHRTRLDAEGRLAITRLDENLREIWTAKLPILELHNRFVFPNGMLLYGSAQVEEKGVTKDLEYTTSLNLKTGAIHSWNVTREQRVP